MCEYACELFSIIDQFHFVVVVVVVYLCSLSLLFELTPRLISSLSLCSIESHKFNRIHFSVNNKLLLHSRDCFIFLVRCFGCRYYYCCCCCDCFLFSYSNYYFCCWFLRSFVCYEIYMLRLIVGYLFCTSSNARCRC